MASTRTAPVPERHRRGVPVLLVPAVLILLGVGVMVYPVVATWYNDAHLRDFARRYGTDVGSARSATVTSGLAAARAYNASLPQTALRDPWGGRAGTATPAYRRYLSQLALTDVMARLRVPSIGVDLPVRHGTEPDTLARGVGHLFGSSLPVGGAGTHAVLTAHSGWEGATLFDRLPEVHVGDRFTVQVYGQTLAYQVDDVAVVLPDALERLGRDGGDHVTLVTCTPRGINTHRLLVRGTRVPLAAADTAEPGAADGLVVQGWMWPRLAASAAALLLLLLLAAHQRHQRRRAATAASEGHADAATGQPDGAAR